MTRTIHPTSLIAFALLALGLPRAAAAADAPLSHQEVSSAVNKHISDVKSCMKKHGSATGKLIVEFGILPDGKVTDAKVKHASSNGHLDRCIVSAFGHWQFPKPRGGVTMGVDYPFFFAAPKVGNLEKQQVLDTIQPHQPEIKACYDQALKQKKDVAGRIEVAIVVAPSGDVTGATVQSSTTGAPALDQCVAGRVKTWHFPKPTGGGDYRFTFPFVLGAAKPAPPKKS